jgi:hypothetical protein
MASTLGQYLDNDGVTDEKVRLRNNQALRARNASGTADVDVVKVTSTNIVSLPTQTKLGFIPTDSDDIASVDYVDTAVATVSFTAGDGLQTIAGVTSVLASDSTLSVGGSGVAVSLAASSGLEVSSGLKAKVDGVTLKINASGELEGLKATNEVKTLTGTDISNGYIDLAVLAYAASVLVISQGIPQTPVTDFTVSTVGGVSRVTFAGDLSAQAISGDKLLIMYCYL